MKNLIFLFLILTSSIVLSQNIEISILENLKKELSAEIIVLNDSIKKIELQINAIKSKEIQQMISDSTLRAIARKNARLKNKDYEQISALIEDKEIIILDYGDDYFSVCIDSICGIMHEVWINKNDKIRKYIKAKDDEQKALKKLVREQKYKKEEDELDALENKYKKKYGEKFYNKLKEGKFWIGMTKEMAIIALDYPDDINRTVGSWGVHEQWVYYKLYLYFENGKLTSYQN
ncbi:hypothetical protein N8258_01540 [Algibacter sp.]|nr:hypothetical protein [Algibacter sp.]